jgi:hypothetical protein
MKKRVLGLFLTLALLLSTLAMPLAVSAATAVYDNDWTGWEAAVGDAYVIENFTDATLNPELSVVSTWGYVNIVDGWWRDRLDYGTTDETVWTFANPILAFGGTWNLAEGQVGGPGSNIEVFTLDGSWVSIGVIDRSYINVFWGFVSDVPFTKVRLKAFNAEGWTENYIMDDMVYSYPLENYVTGGGYIKGNSPLASFGGTVGFVEGFGIIGNFQMVAHDGAATIAYHSNDFEFLYFEGPPATSPVASHSIAVFKGDFTNNRNEDIDTLWIKIVDNGEGKKAPAPDQIGLSLDGINWLMFNLDGGNFQVHNVP